VVGIQKFAAVGKAVGRDVKYTHEQRAFAEDERAGWKLQAKGFAFAHLPGEV
jgi:hypothetical protein